MARYATIGWDVNGSPSESQWTVDADSVAWTEYGAGGESPCCDGALDITTASNQDYGLAGQRRYLGRVAQFVLDPNTGDPIETRYAHGDLTDSTQMQTDEAGDAVDLGAGSGGGGWGGTGVSPVSYTAFGEPVGPGGAGTGGPVGDASRHAGLDSRYLYDGDWGYESGLLGLPGAHAWDASGEGYSSANPNLPPITLQHLGWRWYQPDIGRFIQRDPAGIHGGMNCYVYAAVAPSNRIDPAGADYVVVTSFGVHEFIVVSDPGSRTCWSQIHFFRQGGWGLWGPGVITITPSAPPVGGASPSTPAEDRAILDAARRLKALRPYYCFMCSNCCGFNENVLEEGLNRDNQRWKLRELGRRKYGGLE